MLEQQEIIQKTSGVFPHYPYILRAEIFGSVARGEATEDSDIDFIVQIDPTQRPEGVLRYAVELELENILGVPVDVVHEDLLRESVRQEIEDERVVVYEKSC